ncbi:MAG: hypothetical protein JWL76_223 [Thermoleophilia bacterium]|nr:hypothetical protein [Thermoleophilia bacterium]
MPYAGHYSTPELRTVAPLPPGADPWQAIDPETRDSIVNWDAHTPADPAKTEKSFSVRVVGALVGAGVGAMVGFLLLNGLGRGRYRAYQAKPMNLQASLAWAGIGAAVGAISGFARGRNPLDGDRRAHAMTTLGSRSTVPTIPTAASLATTDPIAGALTLANTPAHSAFASLYG